MRLIKTFPELVLERINECVNTVSEVYFPAIRAIYGSTGQGRVQHIGSCTLLKLKGAKLLLTAAHIIDNNSEATLYVAGAKSLVQIEGDFLATIKPNENRDKDYYDFAIWKISPKTICELGDVKYIVGDEIQDGFASNTGIDAGRLYLALGYPNSKNKRVSRPAKSVKSELGRYTGLAISNASLAKKLGVTGADHLFVEFDQKHSMDSAGKVVNSIRLKGASGGALIDLGVLGHPEKLAKPAVCTGRLAALLIEFHASHNAIVTTRISTILRAISGKELAL